MEQRQAGTLYLQDVALDNLDDAFNEITQLEQRWENRLTFENLSLTKRYLEGELNILITWMVNAGSFSKKYCAIVHRELPQRPVLRSEIDSLGGGFGKMLSHAGDHFGPIKGHSEASVGGPYRDDGLVFIEDVELMESPKGVVPSLVWFQPLYDLDCSGRGSLYRFGKGGFKFIQVLPDNEMDVIVAGPVGVTVADDGDHKQIKGCANVVDGISDNAAPFNRDISLDVHSPLSESGLRICIHENGIRVSGEKLLNFDCKFIDMAFGPFDL